MEDIEDILKLSNKHDLEQAGNNLDLGQAHQILYFLIAEKLPADKFLPILVGMSQGIFYQLMGSLSPEEEHLFKEFGSTEPLLHKLAILAHDWKQDLEALVKDIYEVAAKIESINLTLITKQDIFTTRKEIDELDHFIEEHLLILNCALIIAWNSKRVDLIDSLSTLKDLYLRTFSILIGHTKVNDANATGLYKKLEDRLNQVYSYDSEFTLAPFNDLDPAIEALTSFGIFYLEDYVELGLLPDIRSVKDLKSSLRKKNIQELTPYLESIIAQVEETLKSLGLKNVKSFKDAKIYSKDMLKEYLLAKLAPSKSS